MAANKPKKSTVSIPVRGMAADMITCDPAVVTATFMNRAAAEFGTLPREPQPGVDEEIVSRATAQWAADLAAERAAYYYVHVDLPELARICSEAAMRIALRRAIDDLQSMLPEGLQENRHALWERFSKHAQQRHETREAIATHTYSEVKSHLNDMRISLGRKKGARDSKESARRKRKSAQLRQLQELVRAKAVSDLRLLGYSPTKEAIDRTIAEYKVKPLSREFAPILKATPVAIEKLIRRTRSSKRARK